MPVLVALIPPPSDPSLAAGAYGGMLGDEWTVHGFRDQDDVPDDVAAQAEFVMAASPQAVDARLIKRAPSLRLIQVPGHGFDHVNLDDARAADVPVATIASAGAESHTVAEMALLLAGAAGRRIPAGDRFVREGRWGTQEMLMAGGGVFELAGKTIGIVGFGKIGREVAKRARAFGMNVVYHDVVRPDPAEERELGIEYRELDALLAESDVVSLHAPLTPKTRGLIDARALSQMRAGAILVNTSRGALVDDKALVEALRSGRLRAAAIDVFEPEPPPADSPLFELDNVVLSPHMAGVTFESVLRIVGAALENVKRASRGEQPHDLVTDAEL